MKLAIYIQNFIKRNPVKVSLLIAWIVISNIWGFYKSEFYKKKIPPEIKVSGSFEIDDDTDYFSSGCVVASYWLDNKTADEIKKKGVSFFEDIKESLDGSILYTEWQVTPVSEKSFSDSTIYPSLECGNKLTYHWNWRKKVSEALKISGSYTAYKHNGGAELLVMPELKLVIFTYKD